MSQLRLGVNPPLLLIYLEGERLVCFMIYGFHPSSNTIPSTARDHRAWKTTSKPLIETPHIRVTELKAVLVLNHSGESIEFSKLNI